MAGTKDLVIEQGGTFQKTIVLKDGAGVVIDLTGYTGRGQIRRTYRSEAIVASFTFDYTYLSVGKVTFSLSAAVTEGITAGESDSDIRSKYVYDIELVKTADGTVKRVLKGNVYVSPNVTR